jgi:hypothetical protein
MVMTGNGSSTVIVKDESVLDEMESREDAGDVMNLSGDGFRYYTLLFPEDFDVDSWVTLNFHGYITKEFL